MISLLDSLVRKIDNLTRWSGYILAALIFIITGVICFEVVARYFFNRPTNWAMELATMNFGTYMLGGGAWALLKGGHVKMDIFYNRWSPRTQAIVDACTFPLFIVFFAIIFWKSVFYGIESVQSLEHSHTAWGPPIYHWKMTLPIAVLLILLQGLADFIRNLTLAVTGKEL